MHRGKERRGGKVLLTKTAKTARSVALAYRPLSHRACVSMTRYAAELDGSIAVEDCMCVSAQRKRQEMMMMMMMIMSCLGSH